MRARDGGVEKKTVGGDGSEMGSVTKKKGEKKLMTNISAAFTSERINMHECLHEVPMHNLLQCCYNVATIKNPQNVWVV